MPKFFTLLEDINRLLVEILGDIRKCLGYVLFFPRVILEVEKLPGHRRIVRAEDKFPCGRTSTHDKVRKVLRSRLHDGRRQIKPLSQSQGQQTLALTLLRRRGPRAQQPSSQWYTS